MHYVPESSREFLPSDASGRSGVSRGVHYQSAPLYLLTLAVGGLLLVDVFSRVTLAIPPVFFGFRWALLAGVLGGSRILYHTLEDLSSGRVGAGLALTIAFLAAVLLGEIITAALVVFITLTGECVERYTIDRAHAAIRNVFDLCPPTARVLRDGREEECPLDELQAGDRVVVRPGERVPADGKVLDGETAIDQSALTGESGPLRKSLGDEVFAGTLNQFGAITVSVDRTGHQTLLGQVTETVKQAAKRKSAAERTADRLAKEFLPLVLAAAVSTYCGWWLKTGDSSAGLLPSLGVLVVACPCALVLATPTAVMASLAWLARSGIVVKGSDALERLAGADTFAFDKTGTLTTGEMEIGNVHPLPIAGHLAFDAEQLLFLISTAEQRSEHPLAEPFANLAAERNWKLPAVQEFSATAGGGVSARLTLESLQEAWNRQFAEPFPDASLMGESNGILIRVGNPRWLESEGLPSSADVAQETIVETPGEETTMQIAVNHRLVGQVALRDSLREGVADVLAELKQNGIKELVLLTGDRDAAARSVADALGSIDQTQGEMFPSEKAGWLAEHQRAGHRAVMVGDGINDAPGLIAAHVGIAVARGQHNLAAEAGDIVLLSPDLTALPGLVRLSRAMVRNIRQNIMLFAFGLNGLGMLLCATGILSPVHGAVLHEVGSLAVMLSALRLLWFERSLGPKAGQWRERFIRGAELITTAISPTRLVYRVLDRWNLLLRLTAAAVAAWWLVSNVVFLTHDELAIVTRYGKVYAELDAGWHWRWPAPFERVYREKTGRLRTLSYGFRRDSSANRENRQADIDWTSPHETGGIEPVREESLILTGDEVPIELTAEVHFRVSNLKEYLFGNANPEESLRVLTGQTFRSLAAESTLDEMLTIGRARFEEESRRQLRERSLPLSLGLEISAVHLIDVHPPTGVVPAYRDVANAWEAKEQAKNEAQAAATSRLLEVAGPRALAELKDRYQMDLEATGDRSTELSEEAWRNLAAAETGEEGLKLKHLAGQAADVLLEAAGTAASTKENAQGDADRFRKLQAVYRDQPELTLTELYWKAVEAVLAGRPFTILDPKAVGRRHLFLGDDKLKEFAPMLPPMEEAGAEEVDESQKE